MAQVQACCRLEPKEHEKVQAKAKAEGESLQDFMKHVLLAVSAEPIDEATIPVRYRDCMSNLQEILKSGDRDAIKPITELIGYALKQVRKAADTAV